MSALQPAESPLLTEYRQVAAAKLAQLEKVQQLRYDRHAPPLALTEAHQQLEILRGTCARLRAALGVL